jgi:hypothetical protein
MTTLCGHDHEQQMQGQACDPAMSVNSHHAMHMKNPTDRIAKQTACVSIV